MGHGITGGLGALSISALAVDGPRGAGAIQAVFARCCLGGAAAPGLDGDLHHALFSSCARGYRGNPLSRVRLRSTCALDGLLHIPLDGDTKPCEQHESGHQDLLPEGDPPAGNRAGHAPRSGDLRLGACRDAGGLQGACDDCCPLAGPACDPSAAVYDCNGIDRLCASRVLS